MKIDFSVLPLEETELVEALLGMAWQYCGQSHLNHTPLEAEVCKVLCKYGLLISNGQGFDDCMDQVGQMWLRLRDAEKGGLFLAHDSLKAVEQPEILLLRLLARMTEQYLTDDDGRVWHKLEGAGERAIDLLNRYGLVTADPAIDFRWTSEGRHWLA